jgi:hypothetical protein
VNPELSAVEQSFSKYPVIFVRLKGRNKRVLEYSAVMNPASDFCVLPRVDAYHLGYPEVAQDAGTSFMTRPTNLTTLTTSSGYINAPLISMEEVAVGSKCFRNIDFLAHDLPQETRFDVMLGRSLLSRSGIRIDFSASRFTMEE